jgi:hypothetical protein
MRQVAEIEEKMKDNYISLVYLDVAPLGVTSV